MSESTPDIACGISSLDKSSDTDEIIDPFKLSPPSSVQDVAIETYGENY
jgi:hypothetical protein